MAIKLTLMLAWLHGQKWINVGPQCKTIKLHA